MEKCELKESIDKMTDTIFSEIGTDMLDNKDEDTLNVLKVIKLARKLSIEQNNDIEELKDRLRLMDGKLEAILHEVRVLREKA